MNFPLDVPPPLHKLKKNINSMLRLEQLTAGDCLPRGIRQDFHTDSGTKRQIKWIPKLCCSGRFVCLLWRQKISCPTHSHSSYSSPRFVCCLFPFWNFLWWTLLWRPLLMGDVGCGCWYRILWFCYFSWSANATDVSSGWELSIRRIKV